MKQLKPLKMFVPESDVLPEWVDTAGLLVKHIFVNADDIEKRVRITREKIHQLVKAHAEKLGYWREENNPWKYDAELICLWGDGQITLSNTDNLLNDDLEELKKFQEISPFDFLELTPDDVRQPPQGGSGVPIKPTSTDRNEKADKEVWVKMPIYDNRKAMIVALAESGYNVRMEEVLTDKIFDKYDYYVVFNLSYEFLKQAGNK